MNESPKNSPAVPSRPGEKPPAASDVALAKPTGHPHKVAPADNTASVQSAPVAATPAQPPAAFGGHRGGFKKRADGLVAGSAEAKEADRKADAERKRLERAKNKVATLPPALPGVPSSAGGAPAPVADGASVVPGPAPGAVVTAPVAPAPMFVPWTEKFVSRPIKLLTRIIDRIRCSSLMKRIRRLKLRPEQEKELETDIKFKDEAVNDFNAALTNCVTIELNKRRVPGAENSHWIDLVLTGGELVSTHLSVVDKIEKMILENELKRKEAQGAAQN